MRRLTKYRCQRCQRSIDTLPDSVGIPWFCTWLKQWVGSEWRWTPNPAVHTWYSEGVVINAEQPGTIVKIGLVLVDVDGVTIKYQRVGGSDSTMKLTAWLRWIEV
jgi:hypothetical protein